jgi:hypothetical protein
MTLGSHQKTVGASQNWITPKYILEALGKFDLDPCASPIAPWKCADLQHFSHGLDFEWRGRVWLNPPFNRYEVGKWIMRLAEHGDGIALLHARTEAAWFDPCWEFASSILFLADRLYFYYPSGERAEANSGAPACLVAFGEMNTEALRTSGLEGYLVRQWNYQPGAIF